MGTLPAGHGAIRCGTVLAPDFEAALPDYVDCLGLPLVAEGRVSPDLARSWGAPAQVGCRWALLAAGRGFLRLVGGSAAPAGFRPLASFGWAAFEISVRDAFALHARLEGGPFRVLGAPRHVPGFANFIPFQVAGRSGEILYLNTVLESRMAGLDLPRAQAEVDAMFIAVLAAEDRAATVRFHVDALGFEEGETFRFPYSMINQSFGLPGTHETDVTMTCVGRTPAAEIDQYPAGAIDRPRSPGELPPGNALVSFWHRDLDSVAAPFIEPPVVRDGPLYGGARVATLIGPAGERIELIECS
jgi:catechol 2,3-dioxygenase-like lactoylglutathione lyase family enzyme